MAMQASKVRAAVFAALTIAASPSASADGALWDRAMELAAGNASWVPGTMDTIVEEVDRRGVVKSVETRSYRITAGPDGALDTRLVAAVKDGVDVTQKERARTGGGAPSGRGSGAVPSPFDPGNAMDVEARATGAIEVVAGKKYAEYAFTMPGDGRWRYTGTVLISVDTGVPLRLAATIAPLPALASFFRMSVLYNDHPDRWYPTDLTFEGAGSLLLIYRHFRSTIVFGGYFRDASRK